MKTTIFNTLLAGLLISGMFLTGCSKENSINELNNNPQQISAKDDGDMHPYTSLLNQDLVVYYAEDDDVNITTQFQGLTFRFAGNYPAGQAQVWNDSIAQTGTWSNKQGTDFAINYPTDIFTQLTFFNRVWTIGSSSSSVIRLIGSDGDEVQLSPR
jgi:hypothetical protein